MMGLVALVADRVGVGLFREMDVRLFFFIVVGTGLVFNIYARCGQMGCAYLRVLAV